ncbi:MAG: aldehyde dehydrogenase (NADP(+)) [bacterium]|nr:aldehyde dehydrogenase (NADP(+)) [bacterium]
MVRNNIIGFTNSGKSDKKIFSWNPTSGLKNSEEGFAVANDEEIEEALNLAKSAFSELSGMSSILRAEFLEEIGNQIILLGDHLITTVVSETGLPDGRVIGERGRTVNQLKMFASVVREGLWTEASIDEAIPDRQPNPKSDIRKKLIPIGPVVVFTASNFPLAFSTAGGDAASALAAGNPVIVKAHEAHPATNALVAEAIQRAASICGMPNGTFSTLYGNGNEIGEKLVSHKEVKAVGFTGSFSGGKALFHIANSRPDPIPVFAEMSSVNPVVVFPEILSTESSQIAAKLANSITLGSGQFCTNPGLILIVEDRDTEEFINLLGQKISESSVSPMLTKGILNNYREGIKRIKNSDKVRTVALVEGFENGTPAIFEVDADDFINDNHLAEEVFGPSSLIVRCQDTQVLKSVIEKLDGQLTGTCFGTKGELIGNEDVLQILQSKVGRVIINDVPTGVEVCDSMIHGGPFPATTDIRFTSVGSDAIKRFARPICYQDFPDSLLPLELQNRNPLNIIRKVNGELTRSSLVKLSVSGS